MNYVPALTSLRFFGALSVILLHLGSKAFFDDLGLGRYHILISGVTGVTLFYVLSGFLLTSLALEEIRETGRFDFLRFFVRRALRLFPLYYLAILVIVLLVVLGHSSLTWQGLAYALLYSFNLVPKAYYNGHLGSFHTLATEEHFYLFFGVLFALTAAFLGVRARYMVGTIFLCIVIFVDQLRPIFDSFSATYFVERWTPFAAKPILIGCLAAMIYSSRRVEKLIESIRSNNRIDAAFGYLLLFAGVYLYATLYDHRSNAVASIGFALIFIYFVTYPGSLLARALSWDPLLYLGTIAYGLYVWQAVIIGTGGSSRWIPSGPVSMALILFLSVLSYELFERRFLARKARWRVVWIARNEAGEQGASAALK